MTHKRQNCRRGGYALVLVLGMIAMTLGVCYSMLRVQATSTQVAGNASREAAARQAALAGMSIAIRQMHQSDWQGVDSTINGQINASDSYIVGFTTGDSELASGDDDYRWWPYRVTVTSTGYSTDLTNVNVKSSYQVTAVLQLAPRAFGSTPAAWSSIENYTVYQWDGASVPLNLPIQITGPYYFQGAMLPTESYPYDEKPFHGTIDDVLIFNRALTSTEISTFNLYAMLFSNDSLGLLYWLSGPSHWWRLNEPAGETTVADNVGGQHGTLVGAKTGATGPGFAPLNRGVSFNGRTDHVDLGNLDLPSSGFSISAWFKPDSFGHDDGRIISKATGINDDDHYFMLSTVESGGNYRLRFRLKAGGSTSVLIANFGNLSVGSWVNVVATYDGSYMRLYRNGVLVGTMAKSGAVDANPNVPVFLGDNPPGSSRGQYLRDLKEMADAGNDHRPLTSAVALPRANSLDGDLSLLEDLLGLTLNDVAASNTTPLSFPASGTTYRLYPGGKSYAMRQVAAGSYTNAASTPDPQTNPLGVAYHTGRLTLEDDIDFEGTILSFSNGGDIYLEGSNIQLRPAWLPPLDGSTDTYYLPTAIVSDDIRVRDEADAAIEGLVVAWDDFELTSGGDDTALELEGRVVAKEFQAESRSEWVKSQSWYREQLWDFRYQLEAGGSSVVDYFPQWLEQEESLTVAPKLKIRPPASDIRYHWQNWDEPIFQVHPSDEGLRWDLIRWRISP